MLIMSGDKVVAKPYYNKLGVILGFEAEPWTEFIDLPIALFGFDKRRVTYEAFLSWVKSRCIPENRIGLKEALATIGLDHYDYMEIAMRTGCRIKERDTFWIDFDN